jgi:hypothetical protein
MPEQVTIGLPLCEVCPPFRAWPTRNLITGRCPKCGRFDARSWRMAVARRLLGRSEDAR